MSILAILTFAATAYAHGHVQSITAGGRTTGGGRNGGLSANPAPQSPFWLANNLDNGFVSDPSSPDIICHKGGIPGSTSLSVAAGETLTVQWDTWPDSHAGPVIDYLANVGGDFAGISKGSLQFVKIAEAGLSGGSWAGRELIANGNTWPVTIPVDIAPGNYVLRHEILALHEGQRVGGTQFYPQCVNIEVTGSGTNSLRSGTVGTSLYRADEPGVIFDMYNNPTSYPIPGPPLMAGGSTGGGGGRPPVTSAAPPAATTTQAPPASSGFVTSTRAPAPTAAPPSNGGNNGNAAGIYQQCGGINHTGPTSCTSGNSCRELNPYYFQCLPIGIQL